MVVKTRECRQDNCALAKEYAHIIKCMHTRGRSKIDETATENDYSFGTQEYIAKIMYTRAIELSHHGYASDALSCYHAFIESFESTDHSFTKELVAGAKHNQVMLAKLIFVTS